MGTIERNNAFYCIFSFIEMSYLICNASPTTVNEGMIQNEISVNTLSSVFCCLDSFY